MLVTMQVAAPQCTLKLWDNTFVFGWVNHIPFSLSTCPFCFSYQDFPLSMDRKNVCWFFSSKSFAQVHCSILWHACSDHRQFQTLLAAWIIALQLFCRGMICISVQDCIHISMQSQLASSGVCCAVSVLMKNNYCCDLMPQGFPMAASWRL